MSEDFPTDTRVTHFIQALILAAIIALYLDRNFFEVLLGAFVLSLGAQFVGYAFGVGSTKATIAETEDYAAGGSPND